MSKSKCPICSKPSDVKLTPFCSKRCADVDLSRWLKGSYAIPGRPVVDEDEGGEVSRKPNKNEPSDGPD